MLEVAVVTFTRDARMNDGKRENKRRFVGKRDIDRFFSNYNEHVWCIVASRIFVMTCALCNIRPSPSSVSYTTS